MNTWRSREDQLIRCTRISWMHCRRALIAATLVAVFGMGIPNRYESEAKVIPQLLSGDTGTAGALSAAAAVLGVSIGAGPSDPGSIYVDVIQSRWMVDKLLNTQFQFTVKTWLFGKVETRRQTLFEYINLDNRDKAAQEVQDKVLAVDRDLKSGTIHISATTRSPQLSQLVVHRCTAYLQEFLRTQGQSQGGAKARFLVLRITEATGEVDQSESAFRNFLLANRNYGVSSDPNVKLTGMRLEADLITKRQILTSLILAREQAILAEKNDLGQLTMLDAGNLPELKASPRRGLLIGVTFILIFMCSVVWNYRAILADYFFAKET